ncbi:MAG: molecular chaperone HtpG [Gammaproteobacteria bacterium]|nr:molecular chaperone HtpG [Gammaproteobacteria bacterium]
MVATAERETLGFQAEVKQLLHLMIHSLYSNREIFLRELISNASDACDKLRFEALATPSLLEDSPELAITVEVDDKARVIRISDNGVGMSREEVIDNLGTIARSGTAQFLSQLSGDSRRDAQLIGQFGVGFYSAFIVADRVEVTTRRAGLDADAAVLWSSDGQGEFTIEPATRDARGTTVTLHLKEDAAEFATTYRIESLVRRYSDHIAFPVKLAEAGKDEARALNTAQALWTRPRNEIEDSEYIEFYKHIAHDAQAPLAWSHHKVEGTREFTGLMYVPAHAPWDLWNREAPRGLKLYVQRVFIMDDAEQFLPLYLRFMRGVVDSAELSLNVSRELLQQDAHVDAIRKALTRKALDMLEKLAADEPEKYRTVWQQFGEVLKEGMAEDFANRERVAALLRFDSTANDEAAASVSLPDYLARRKESQKHIYYLLAESPEAARASPQLEMFRKHGVEVLLLTERIDEWMMQHLREFNEAELHDIARADLDLSDIGEAADDKLDEVREQAHAALLDRLKKTLSGRAEDVRISRRLTDSPACLVLGADEPGIQMRRIMEAAGQPIPETLPVLEINPGHPLVERLEALEDKSHFADLAHLLLDQARLAEGRQLKDPGAFVQRLNRLLLEPVARPAEGNAGG